MPTSMASLYPNTTSEGYEHFKNESMNDTIHDSSLWDRDMFHFILFTVVGGPMCVVGFVANIICYKVLKMDKKHQAANFLLQALAVADNIILTFSIFILSIILGLLPMLGAREKFMSKVILAYVKVYVVPFVVMALAATVWITVLIAINRYIAVCRPLDAHRLASLKRTKIQVVVVFTVAIIFSFPLFFKYAIVYPEDNSMTVPISKESSLGPNTLFGLVYTIMLYIIIRLILPLVLLIILNSKIIWELRKADKRRDVIRQNGRSENNITVVMVVIIIVFIVCNIPFHIHVVALYTGHVDSLWRYRLYRVSEVLQIANSSTNFVVYYVLRKSFRRAFSRHSASVSLRSWSRRTATADMVDTVDTGGTNAVESCDLNRN